jgi:dihydroxyacetone kinase
MARAFLSDRHDAVDRALAGFVAAHPDLVELSDDPVFVRAKDRDPRRRVGLVSGGGSGHEPMHVGLVGRGMLDAAVPGKIFASPHNRQVYRASQAVAGDGGVLHIVKNYTGDRINFGIAAERLAGDGIEVARVLVDDDLATDSADTGTGRRGTGATIIVEKLLGAAADEGMDLPSLAGLGRRIVAHSRSIAVASAAQTSPGTGKPAFEIPEGELEYGVGIHGERASRTIARPALDELIETMVGDLITACPAGDRVLVLLNGLGGTTSLELHHVFAGVADALQRRQRTVVGSLVGTYIPALDMHGFSVTITVIDDPDWLRWWVAPAWTAAVRVHKGTPC